jgi:tetratricopeptide (TPR) repeat protein
MALGNLASGFVVLGCYADAERYARETIALAEKSGNEVSLAFAWMNLGNSLSLQGRFDEAEAALTEAFTRAQRAEHPEVPDFIRCYLAHLYLMRSLPGDAQLALGLAGEVLANTHSGDLQLDAYGYLWRARAQLALGDTSRALASIEQALQIRQDMGSLEEEEEELLYSHYLILSALSRVGDASAPRRAGEAWSALVRAHSFVETRSQKLSDAAYRETYLTNSLAVVAILHAWQAGQ